MPVYVYKGFDAAGKNVSGTRDADSPKAVKTNLKNEGVYLTQIREAGGKKAGGGKSKGGDAPSRFAFLTDRVSSQELAMATRQLATLIGAGIPLVESLSALVDQVDSEVFKHMWADVKSRVNEGASFGDALSSHPNAFSGLYVNMVRAGESSGALDIVLERLADFTESQAELRSKLIGTMIYPIIMIIMAMGVTGILFIFVIPKISKIFESQKVALPLPTQVMMGLAEFATNWWWLVMPSVVASFIWFLSYIRSKNGKPKWDRFLLNAPLFGPLVRMVAITRFSKTLATLLASGVPLLMAFDIVRAVVENHVLMEVLETAKDAVKEGENIADPLRRSGEFPPMVTHMIAVGEKTGQLEEMLGNIAHSYEVQVNARLQAMTSLLEPILLVGMGIVVAFIVFSVMLPMLELNSFAG